MSKAICSCIRCGGGFEQTDPPTGYCAACVRRFKDELALRRARSKPFNTGSATAKAVPAPPPPEACEVPATISATGTGFAHCGLCGSMELTDEYGHSVFGCGVYVDCHTCGAVLDFRPDTGK